MSQNNESAEAMNVEFYPSVAAIEATPTLDPRAAETRRAEEQLACSQGSFVLRPEFMALHGLNEYLLQSSRFAEREDWAVGRQDSTYGVFFGELEMAIDDGKTVIVGIAAKPYRVLERERAVHEYAGLEYFNGHSELKTFQPIGFWINKHGDPVLLTVFEEPVKSFDNVDWGKTGEAAFDGHYDLLTALQKSAQILARLHASGFAHRDAQIKNMAVDTHSRGVRLIDLTTLTVVDGGNQDQITKWSQLVYDDLRTLVGSVRSRGYLAEDTTENAREMIKLALLDPHNSMLRHPGNSYRLDRTAVASLGHISAQILESV